MCLCMQVLRDNFLRVRGYVVVNVAWWRWHASSQEGGQSGVYLCVCVCARVDVCRYLGRYECVCVCWGRRKEFGERGLMICELLADQLNLRFIQSATRLKLVRHQRLHTLKARKGCEDL
jgi:hypothetical protein